ncbi:hypothetical protein [Helicobacter sp. T3_23-1056]
MTEVESLSIMTVAKTKKTHPLAPSAREGGQKENSHNDDKSVDCHEFATQILAMTESISANRHTRILIKQLD